MCMKGGVLLTGGEGSFWWQKCLPQLKTPVVERGGCPYHNLSFLDLILSPCLNPMKTQKEMKKGGKLCVSIGIILKSSDINKYEFIFLI